MEDSLVTSTQRDLVEQDHVDRFLAELNGPAIDLTVEGIVDRITGISRRLRRSMNETLTGVGLSWEEWKLICTLRNRGEPYRLSPGELAQKQELSSGAMTNRLDRLEEAGFVRRLPNPDDRRSLLVELTDAGHQVWHDSIGAQAEKEALIAAAALDSTEREQLNVLLRRLMRAFERLEEAGGAGGRAG
jgi:DNA-binding MarR family transcriptional regulator